MSTVKFDFTGKIALVTGAGRGIGREIAKALAAAGAETYALSKTLENLQSLAAEVPTIHLVCVDLANWEATRKAVEEIGKIDLLVNNAGIHGGYHNFSDLTEDVIDSVFAVNLKPVINVSQVVAKKLIENDSPGSIVNISSNSSTTAAPYVGIYCSSKGALDQMTRVMASELGVNKIRVNSVNPGFVNTDMTNHLVPDDMAILINKTPLGRVSEISDVVGSVLFLLSDLSSMMNGAFLTIDGGQLIRYL